MLLLFTSPAGYGILLQETKLLRRTYSPSEEMERFKGDNKPRIQRLTHRTLGEKKPSSFSCSRVHNLAARDRESLELQNVWTFLLFS